MAEEKKTDLVFIFWHLPVVLEKYNKKKWRFVCNSVVFGLSWIMDFTRWYGNKATNTSSRTVSILFHLRKKLPNIKMCPPEKTLQFNSSTDKAVKCALVVIVICWNFCVLISRTMNKPWKQPKNKTQTWWSNYQTFWHTINRKRACSTAFGIN